VLPRTFKARWQAQAELRQLPPMDRRPLSSCVCHWSRFPGRGENDAPRATGAIATR
jgi:hypothetical protein